MDEIDNAEALAAQFQDRLAGLGGSSSSSSNRRRGRGSRGGRGGRGGGGRAVDISRALSKLLRHQATSAGIELDGEGYARLDRVLSWGTLRAMHVTVAEVRDVVASNEKQRFGLRGGEGGDNLDDPTGWSIRANQGHSIPLASDGGLLEPLVDAATAPAIVCHGTSVSVWPAIEASGGLRPMGRNHVHCGCLEGEGEGSGEGEAEEGEADIDADAAAATTLLSLTSAIPGLRKNADLLVFLDVRRALREDPSIRWWRSANGVVLSEGNADGVVPVRFFRRVLTTAASSPAAPPCTLWRDGTKVADLPPDLLARARRRPPGKLNRPKAATDGRDEEKKTQHRHKGKDQE